jgi:hypothetical protein
MAFPMRRTRSLARGAPISRTTGASCGSAKASPIAGRTVAIITLLTGCPSARRASEGAVQLGLGETVRDNRWGRDQKYVVAFLSGGSPQHGQPLVEFVAADDYEQPRELVAVIRGSDGARPLYGAGDALPTIYPERFRTQIYNERGGRLEQGRRGRARGR